MSLSLQQFSPMIHAFKPNYHRLGRPCQYSRISCRSSSVDMGKHVHVETNFYELLSLESKDASVAEIKKAYRSVARVYHPDICPHPRKEESTQIFLQLHMAYETLSDGLEPRWENQLSGLKMRSDLRMRRKSRSSKTSSTA